MPALLMQVLPVPERPVLQQPESARLGRPVLQKQRLPESGRPGQQEQPSAQQLLALRLGRPHEAS